MRNQRLLSGVLVSVCALLFFSVFLIGGGGASSPPGPPSTDPTTTVPPAGECANEVHYFRHDLDPSDNRFGEGFDWPAWQADPKNDLNEDGVVDVKDVQIDLHNRRCVDPALTVAHVEYSQRNFSSAEERLRRTEELVNNREAWGFAIVGLEAREATAVKVEIVKMSDPYRTLYMVNTPIPQIYQDALDRPEYWVLRFTYKDGTVDNFKLDCGYQPVEPEFPPDIPDVPPCTKICGPPPTTAPPTTGPPTTGPPTTGPPTTTCPTWICKGPVPPGPPPCVDAYGNQCTTQPGAGGQPGDGGAENPGDDGYGGEPPPPSIVPPPPPPSSVVTLPPTTAPPPPTSIVIPG